MWRRLNSKLESLSENFKKKCEKYHHKSGTVPRYIPKGLIPDPITKQVKKVTDPAGDYLRHVNNTHVRHQAHSSTRTVTKYFSNLSFKRGQRWVNYLENQTSFIESERPVSNVYNPPKIHENSVFLYQASESTKNLRRARLCEIPAALLILMTSAEPGLALAIGLSWWFLLLRPGHIDAFKRTVVRMDLLPHIESVAFQKVGFGGKPVTRIVRLCDLEKFEPIFGKENAFWLYNRNVDRDLVYRDKTNGEVFVFDTNGYWSWEGLSHKLIY